MAGWLMVLPVALVAAAAPPAQNKAFKKEQQLLQGNWRLVSLAVVEKGRFKEIPRPKQLKAATLRLIFKSDKMYWEIKPARKGRNPARLDAYTLDTTKNPKQYRHLATISIEETGKPKRFERLPVIGIYAISRDRLMMCEDARPGKTPKPAPTGFPSREKPGKADVVLMVFKRVKRNKTPQP